MPGEGLTATPAQVAPASDDTRLLSQVVRGDRLALAHLYDRHAPVLLAIGARILRDTNLAEDVLHDVFLEAWHHAGEFDAARGSVRAWLVTRMRSRALDRKGKVTRGARLVEAVAREEIGAGSEGIAGADRALVRHSVTTLPAELVAIVQAAYFDGLTATEIATRLGLPVGTVKSRLARAISVLREKIRPEAGEAR